MSNTIHACCPSCLCSFPRLFLKPMVSPLLFHPMPPCEHGTLHLKHHGIDMIGIPLPITRIFPRSRWLEALRVSQLLLNGIRYSILVEAVSKPIARPMQLSLKPWRKHVNRLPCLFLLPALCTSQRHTLHGCSDNFGEVMQPPPLRNLVVTSVLVASVRLISVILFEYLYRTSNNWRKFVCLLLEMASRR